jgi:signal transduction histidine kinase
MAEGSNGKILKDLTRDLKVAHKKVAVSIAKIEASVKKSGGKQNGQEKKKIDALFYQLASKISSVQQKIKKESDKKTESFKNKIEKIARMKAVVQANNHLLEVKRRNLLLKSSEIETAYEEISERNKELLKQKEEIDAQTEMLRIANQDITEKNHELETRAESLLDQTDYLHEANETISNMHDELAKQKDEILHKNEELQSLNDEKSNLIGIVAHDLKSPLNQIKGLVSLIKMTSNLDGEAANCLNMIESSAVRLNSMIGKILDIEAIESRQLNLNIEEVDVSEIFQSLASRFRLDAAQKDIKIHTSTSNGITIPVDKNYLTQILENLLSNAIKFSPASKNVYFNLHDKGDYVIGEVRDEGPGLTDDDKKKLFSKYQKLSAKPTGTESSTGLGLSIVKKFTESMGGQIWCESEEGKGASFFVKFNKTKLN